VLNLRAELARLLGEGNPSDIALYAWTDYSIPRIPLVVDLPSNMDPMVIGVLNTRSPGESFTVAELHYSLLDEIFTMICPFRSSRRDLYNGVFYFII
jgi:hypothetical protein